MGVQERLEMERRAAAHQRDVQRVRRVRGLGAYESEGVAKLHSAGNSRMRGVDG
jgi:hypothetical protein